MRLMMNAWMKCDDKQEIVARVEWRCIKLGLAFSGSAFQSFIII